jgi:proliferating cell nuclear antigen
MKLVLNDSDKLDKFVFLFKCLKNISVDMNIYVSIDGMFIQTMDSTHTLLGNLKISKEWFDTFEIADDAKHVLGINVKMLCSILACAISKGSMEMEYNAENDADTLSITFATSDSSAIIDQKYFKLPLMDLDQDVMEIPDSEYEADISLKSTMLHELTNEIANFSSDIVLFANEEKVELKTGKSADSSECKYAINIDIEKLEEFSIDEDCNIDMAYNAKFINMLSSFYKLSDDVLLNISSQLPLCFVYNLGDESELKLYIAPKVD